MPASERMLDECIIALHSCLTRDTTSIFDNLGWKMITEGKDNYRGWEILIPVETFVLFSYNTVEEHGSFGNESKE